MRHAHEQPTKLAVFTLGPQEVYFQPSNSVRRPNTGAGLSVRWCPPLASWGVDLPQPGFYQSARTAPLKLHRIPELEGARFAEQGVTL